MGGFEWFMFLVFVLLVVMFIFLCSWGVVIIEEGMWFLICLFFYNNIGVCNYGCSVKFMKYCFGYVMFLVNIVYCWIDLMFSYEILGVKK